MPPAAAGAERVVVSTPHGDVTVHIEVGGAIASSSIAVLCVPFARAPPYALACACAYDMDESLMDESCIPPSAPCACVPVPEPVPEPEPVPVPVRSFELGFV